MQFKVPQDVQRKDTIIWSLTLQQMIICGIGGGIAYAAYIAISKTYMIEAWLPPVVITLSITAAFAFLKIHSLPFHEFLMNFIEYHLLTRQRIWIQGSAYPFISDFDDKKENLKKPEKVENRKQQKSLEELSKVLDSHGGGLNELSSEEKKKGLSQFINHN